MRPFCRTGLRVDPLVRRGFGGMRGTMRRHAYRASRGKATVSNRPHVVAADVK
jgi:hypothetical protein